MRISSGSTRRGGPVVPGSKSSSLIVPNGSLPGECRGAAARDSWHVSRRRRRRKRRRNAYIDAMRSGSAARRSC